MTESVEELILKLDDVDDVSQKIDLLNSISLRMFTFNPSEALANAEKAHRLATKRRDKGRVGESLRVMGICKVTMAQYHEALEGYRKARAIFEEIGDSKQLAATLHSIGFAYIRMGEYARALEMLERCLEIRRELGDETGEVQTLNIVGLCYTGLADYTRALDHYLQCLNIYERLGDQTGITWTIADIGTVLIQLGELDRALEYSTRSLDLSRALVDKRIERAALLNLGIIHGMHGQFDEALAHFTPALTLSRELGDRADEALTLAHIGRLYARREKPEEAFDYFFPALEIAQQIGAQHQEFDLRKLIGEVHLALGNPESLECFEFALEGATRLGDRQLQLEIHENLSRYYEQNGDATSALRHYKLHAQIREEILGRDKQRAILQLEMRAEMEQAEKEQQSLRHRNDQLEQAMEHKAKELTTLTLHLVEKNHFLDALKKEMAEHAGELDGKARVVIRSLMRQVEGNISGEDDWKAFEAQFEQVHHDFLRNLVTTYPDLTRTELKVCALLKLNLASKEIANMLSTDVRNIESHRYRIRKKLKLRGDIPFTTFFAQM